MPYVGGNEYSLIGVDTRFCTYDLIKEDDQNDHSCTQNS